MFIAQFTIAKYWKQPKFPSANESIKKLRYIYTMETEFSYFALFQEMVGIAAILAPVALGAACQICEMDTKLILLFV